MPKELICLGRFGKPFGLKGEIYFNLFGSKEILENTKVFFLEDRTKLRVEHLSVGPDGRYVIKFRGFDTPERVQGFVNQKVYVKGRSGSGDIYTTSELLEMSIVVNGEVVGKVLDLQGSEDAPYLVVDLNGKEARVAFTKQALHIDRESKTIQVLSEEYLV
jgi:16S rRNA processing protein RimM